MNPAVQLDLELSRSKMPVARVLTSRKPDEWTMMPSPPLESDFSDSSAFFEAYGLWSQKVKTYGSFDPQIGSGYGSFKFVPKFLEIGTSPMGLVFTSNAEVTVQRDEAAMAQRRLVEALKSILSKCHDIEANEVKPVKAASNFDDAGPQGISKVAKAGNGRIVDTAIAENKLRDELTFWIMVAGGMLCLGVIGGFAIARSGNRQFGKSANSSATSGPGGVRSFVVLIVAAFGVIMADQKIGPIFPDLLYCVVGAGTVIEQPGHTEASSWSANNGCTAYEPRCATHWNYTPPTSSCLHGTLWDAIESKIKRMQRDS